MKKIITVMMAPLVAAAALTFAPAPALAAPALSAIQVQAAASVNIATKKPSWVQKTAITRQPITVTVTHGGNATFTVKASGKNLRYEWQIRGAGKNYWSYFHRGSNPNGVLTRAALSENNSSIRVLVTGANGYTYSRTVSLKVKTALKPSITKVSHPATNHNANVQITLTGKNLSDVHTVSYFGWTGKKVPFTKSKTSIKITLPKQPVPGNAMVVVASSSGSYSVGLKRVRVLSAVSRKAILNQYDSKKRKYGSPTGKVGVVVNQSVAVVKRAAVLEADAQKASRLINYGFACKEQENTQANLNRQLSALKRAATKRNAKSNAAQQQRLKSQLAASKSKKDSCLRSMRALGAKV